MLGKSQKANMKTKRKKEKCYISPQLERKKYLLSFAILESTYFTS